jgi:hypothetical protein
VERDFNAQLDFGDHHLPKQTQSGESVMIAGRNVVVTPVFYAYWTFAAERQEIFFRRLRRTNVALTNDPVLNAFRFTNAYCRLAIYRCRRRQQSPSRC